jgi:hypothetical protein
MDFSKDRHELEREYNDNMIYNNKINNNCVRKNSFLNNKKSTIKENVFDEKTDNLEKNEYKKDDSKWKFNKNELMERKKKLLKDRSNIKIFKK